MAYLLSVAFLASVWCSSVMAAGEKKLVWSHSRRFVMEPLRPKAGNSLYYQIEDAVLGEVVAQHDFDAVLKDLFAFAMMGVTEL